MVPPSSDLHGHWNRCKLDPAACDKYQIETLQGYSTIHSLTKIIMHTWISSIKFSGIANITFTSFLAVWLVEFSPRLHLGFRRDMLLTVRVFIKYSYRGGLFLNSCFAHCQSESQDTWFGAGSPRIQNKVPFIYLFFLRR